MFQLSNAIKAVFCVMVNSLIDSTHKCIIFIETVGNK